MEAKQQLKRTLQKLVNSKPGTAALALESRYKVIEEAGPTDSEALYTLTFDIQETAKECF